MASATTQSLRLFYALWPDDETRAALAKLQAATSGRKTRYENLHLTLAFLGQQSSTLLPALQEIVASLPKTNMPLMVDRIGYFSKSRLAWAGMHAAPNTLFQLQRHLKSKLVQKNIVAGTQAAFRPHITLARDAAVPANTVFQPVLWHARDICLVASSTEPDGVRYRILAFNS